MSTGTTQLAAAADAALKYCYLHDPPHPAVSVIFVNENENENGEKRENNEFVNEN